MPTDKDDMMGSGMKPTGMGGSGMWPPNMGGSGMMPPNMHDGADMPPKDDLMMKLLSPETNLGDIVHTVHSLFYHVYAVCNIGKPFLNH